MELIRISDRKLKIMLTPTDMCHFELDADSFDENSERMHRSFRRLLEEVKDRIGFVADDHHISVQYFPSREGGCEMFISTPPIEARCDPPALPDPTPPTKAPTSLQIHPGRRTKGSFHRDGAYRFFRLDDLLAVCQRLLSIGYIGESEAFRDEEKRYYLLLSMLSSSPFAIPEELAFIVEYGEIRNPALTRLYLREHATRLSSRSAVSELGPLA